MGINFKEVKEQAQKEVLEEQKERAVRLYTEKLRELNEAKNVVSNLEREIELLGEKIEEGNY